MKPEKYPKAWELYGSWYCYEKHNYPKNVPHHVYISDNFQFLQHFGYLVLEFFPKHGIKIGMYTDGSFSIKTNDWICHKEGGVMGFRNPQEAIEKALELLEGKLNDYSTE